MANCSSCQAPITWATSAVSGKDSPMEPRDDGAFVLTSRTPPMLPTFDLAPVGDPRPRWGSHFATCPQAAQHRR